MNTRMIALVVFLLAAAGSISAAVDADAETRARTDYEAAGKANSAAEAAIGPIKVAMQKADAESAGARKIADAKRQQATDAKNLAGEPGVQELKQAEDNVPAAIKALTEATDAKPGVDKALADAKAAAAPLQQAYDADEKTAKEAEAAAKIAAAASNQLDDEAKRAAVQAVAKRRSADLAKAALARARQSEQNLQEQANAAPKKLAEAESLKKTADEALASAQNRVGAATSAYQAAEQAASIAQANAAVVSDSEKQKAEAEARDVRKTADAAKNTLTQAQENEKKAAAVAAAAAQKLAMAPAQKKAAEETLAKAASEVSLASTARRGAEDAAQAAEAAAKAISTDAAKSAEEKKTAADQAGAERKAADGAKTVLAQVQQDQQTAQVQFNSAAKNLSDAPAQKKAADEALAAAEKQMAAADGTCQSADKAAQAAEVKAKVMAERAGRSKDQEQQAEADAIARRKEADAAKAVLAQAQAARHDPENLANAAAQKLARLTAQKKLTDAEIANIKVQIASSVAASDVAEQAAVAAAKLADEKNQAAAAAAGKRKAAADAEAALVKPQQDQQQAQTQAAAASQKLAESQTRKKSADAALAEMKDRVAVAAKALAEAEKSAEAPTAQTRPASPADAPKPTEAEKKQTDAKRKAIDIAKAALAKAQDGEKSATAQVEDVGKKLTAAEAQQKAADALLASDKDRVAAAAAANQAAQQAGKDLLLLDAASKQAAADAAAKRKAARTAKAALAPVQQKLEQALVDANSAERKLTQAESRKKSAEETLVSLKERIAAAKVSYVADEQAAQAAEATAAPLKAEAEKTRSAYSDALKFADDKRASAEQAKAALYRLVAGREVASVMESPDAPAPANGIDDRVFAKLHELGIKPVLCSDAVFIRRAYLDLTGTLPSAEDARAFIQSSDKNKRVALIDRLLDEPAHLNYWAMKWCDVLRVKAEFPVKVWPNAAQAYHRWIWESVAQNKPYDQFARELLTSSGSNFRVGPVNFYRAIQDKTPEGIASAVGLAFMGTRIYQWPEGRRSDMTLFFSQVGYKPTSEWKEEIVFWDPLKSTNVPGSTAAGIDSVAKSVTATNQIAGLLAQPMTENGPLAVVFPDGAKITIPPDRDPREAFADWLIRPENPWFAKAIVNRTWAWVMGRGIIHEPDNIRDENPPSNPELLAFLQKEFVSSGYNMKHLKRLIFTSTTYQFSSIPRFKDSQAMANFASYPLRRMEAEVLIDALNNITGSSDLYTSAVPEPFTYIPSDMSAVALADGSITSSFLTLFGRSARATGVEGERINELASPQWLHMLNSATLQRKLQDGPKLAALLASGGKANEIAERLYLTILSRFPTDADLKAADQYAKAGAARGRDAWIDLTWALINSPEFLLRH